MHAGHPLRSHRDRSLDVRLRFIQSDDIVRHAQIKLETKYAREQRGERFWGRRALNPKIQRLLNPAYNRQSALCGDELALPV